MSTDLSNTHLPSHPQSRRREIAELLALGLIRHRQRQYQRSKKADENNLLAIDSRVWIDTCDNNMT